MKTGDIILKDINLEYPIYEKVVWDRFRFFIKKLIPFSKSKKKQVLKNISLKIDSGNNVGFVGLNGAGKTTLLKIISGLISPDSGEVKTKGKIMTLLSLGLGFKPNLTGRENILYGAIMLHHDLKNFKSLENQIIEFSELGNAIDQPFFTYSSGMKSRLGFSLATHINADIVILDETLASGDRSFINKCYLKIDELLKSPTTVLFVSHNVGEIARLTNKAILIDQGELISFDSTDKIINNYDKILFQRHNKFFDKAFRRNIPNLLNFKLNILDTRFQEKEIIYVGDTFYIEIQVNSESQINDLFIELILKDNVNTNFISFIQPNRWNKMKEISSDGLFNISKGNNKILIKFNDFNLGEGNYYFDLNYSFKENNSKLDTEQVYTVPFIKGFFVSYKEVSFKGSNCLIEFNTEYVSKKEH